MPAVVSTNYAINNKGLPLQGQVAILSAYSMVTIIMQNALIMYKIMQTCYVMTVSRDFYRLSVAANLTIASQELKILAADREQWREYSNKGCRLYAYNRYLEQ